MSVPPSGSHFSNDHSDYSSRIQRAVDQSKLEKLMQGTYECATLLSHPPAHDDYHARVARVIQKDRCERIANHTHTRSDITSLFPSLG